MKPKRIIKWKDKEGRRHFRVIQGKNAKHTTVETTSDKTNQEIGVRTIEKRVSAREEKKGKLMKKTTAFERRRLEDLGKGFEVTKKDVLVIKEKTGILHEIKNYVTDFLKGTKREEVKALQGGELKEVASQEKPLKKKDDK